MDGFNNGRLAGLKGLLQANINIVSVTDCTKIDWHWAKRAKKRQRSN